MQVDCNVEDTGIYTFPPPAIFLVPETWFERLSSVLEYSCSVNFVTVWEPVLMTDLAYCVARSFYVYHRTCIFPVIVSPRMNVELRQIISYLALRKCRMAFSCIEGLDYQCKPFH